MATTAYPRDFAARNNFGVYYNNAGEFEQALKQYHAATDIAPVETSPLAYSLVRVLDDEGRAVGPWAPQLDAGLLRGRRAQHPQPSGDHSYHITTPLSASVSAARCHSE